MLCLILGGLAIYRCCCSSRSSGISNSRNKRSRSAPPSSVPPKSSHLFPSAPEKKVCDEELPRFNDILGLTDPALMLSAGTLPHHLGVIRAALRADLEADKRVHPGGGGQLHEPIDDIAVIRFLVSAKSRDDIAITNLRNYLAWRRKLSGSIVPPSAWIKLAPVFVPFADKYGRPVLVMRLQYLNVAELPLDLLEQGFCATLDVVVAHCLANRASASLPGQNPLDQCVCLMDADGAGRRNFSIAAVKMMQSMASTRYGERVAVIYVLSPNMTVRTAWKMVTPLILERTRRHVQLVPRSQIAAVIQDLVGEEARHTLPPAYGGTGRPWPAPSEAKSLEERVGALAAGVWRKLGTVPDEGGFQLPAAGARSSGRGGARGQGNGCHGCLPGLRQMEKSSQCVTA